MEEFTFGNSKATLFEMFSTHQPKPADTTSKHEPIQKKEIPSTPANNNFGDTSSESEDDMSEEEKDSNMTPTPRVATVTTNNRSPFLFSVRSGVICVDILGGITYDSLEYGGFQLKSKDGQVHVQDPKGNSYYIKDGLYVMRDGQLLHGNGTPVFGPSGQTFGLIKPKHYNIMEYQDDPPTISKTAPYQDNWEDKAVSIKTSSVGTHTYQDPRTNRTVVSVSPIYGSMDISTKQPEFSFTIENGNTSIDSYNMFCSDLKCDGFRFVTKMGSHVTNPKKENYTLKDGLYTARDSHVYFRDGTSVFAPPPTKRTAFVQPPPPPKQTKKMEEDDDRTCKVCLDQPVCMVIQPCFHTVLCEKCAPQIKETNSCPICRKEITDVNRFLL